MAEVAYIGLGSNLGDGLKNLQTAWQRLGLLPGITLEALSSPYRTSPVGMRSTFWFTNAAGRIKTGLEPLELLQNLLRIEQEMGRQRALGQDRQIDLDILLFGSRIITVPGLSVPHPQMHTRLFVLEPLCELDAELRHPVLGRSMRELRDEMRRDPGQSIEKSHWQ
ncbi:MAG: 2-amino-4-hydroxy-6-hydroxymethyldihydropteridine diphosphokinase [Deltaproteobacteria bacterium]